MYNYIDCMLKTETNRKDSINTTNMPRGSVPRAMQQILVGLQDHLTQHCIADNQYDGIVLSSVTLTQKL